MAWSKSSDTAWMEADSSSTSSSKTGALPSEQDRKRFIGCLAAILAAAYDYDEQDDPDFGTENFASLENGAESFYESEEEHDVNPDTGKPELPRNEKEITASNKHRSQKASERAKLSVQRHRRRRYGVMCELLVTSSDLLFLDKIVARAYLPMLGRVLLPQNKAENIEPLQKSADSSRPGEVTVPDSPKDDKSSPKDFIPEEVDREDIMRPFLESLTTGSGFQCLSLLMLRHLLSSEAGYDSRIRHVLKEVGIRILIHEMENDPNELQLLSGKGSDRAELSSHAARKFESLERSIAKRLILLSESNRGVKANGTGVMVDKEKKSDSGLTREKIVRGVKIGSSGIVAGTLFALTGGLAAPGIAAGLAAVAGSTAAVGLLSSTAVVTTIFGVGGGSLAAYKMQRRTQGLTEFAIRKEPTQPEGSEKDDIEPELFNTICISGWLRDEYDFQRPWGLHPTNPRLDDRLELLQRFYSIHCPDEVPNCGNILASWGGKESELWEMLREKYGSTPDHLFPLSDGPKIRGALSLEQDRILDQIFVELGYNNAGPKQDSRGSKQPTRFERMQEMLGNRNRDGGKQTSDVCNSVQARPLGDLHNSAENDSEEEKKGNGDTDETKKKPLKHLATVWDYSTTYGGEMYTVRWESGLLQKLCDNAADMARDVLTGAIKDQILKQTILRTLLSAIIWPTYLLKAASVIDGDWTLTTERADQAGIELARSILSTKAGRRPVILVGFSFGARVVFSCLNELARLQEDWEDYLELKALKELSSEDAARLAELQQKFDGMQEPASVVEDAIMMGLPNRLNLSSWRGCRQVVAGRLVNCYSKKDLILRLMFQAKRVGNFLNPVCGTSAVQLSGVENMDISDLVSGHLDYCFVTGKILERVRHGQPWKLEPSEQLHVDVEHEAN